MTTGLISLMFNTSHLARKLILILGCITVVAWLPADDLLPSGFSESTAIEQRLQQTKMELRQLAPDSDRLSHELLKRLESTIYEHRATAEALTSIESQLEQAKEATHSWGGFDEPAPYAIEFVDKLRMQQVALERLQTATAVRTHIINRSIESASNQLADFQRIERQLIEQAETASTPAARQQAIVSAQQADVSSRIQAEKLAYLGLRERGVQVELATFKVEQELLELQLDSVEGHIAFTESELDSILDRIEEERAQAFASLNAANGDLQTSDVQFAWLEEFLYTEEQFWKARHTALSVASLAERKKALDTIRALSETVDDWAQIGEAMVNDRLIGKSESVADPVVRNELQRVIRLQNQINFAIAEVEGPAFHAIGLLDLVVDTVFAIRDTELYLVEETSMLDGQKVNTHRAITVGKLLQLTIILIIGWFLLKFLSHNARTIIGRRPGISPATANSIGHWIFGLGLALLIIYGLNRVRIPFTAFAFLGGTLAIGIGFGAQTLLKNFISGIILSLERPFKVGDLIEVEDVNGKIKSIGLRASVIEHFDGVETLIPNSILLEGKVNNWTYGKTALRGSVKVGVTYGSSTRDVSRLLLAIALEHGLVLENPEPEVRFDDFGDNALVFRLLFWVDASKTQRERLASDLRFMIDKALAESGIAVPFPQRDIHFDTSRPLRVEVSAPESEGASE